MGIPLIEGRYFDQHDRAGSTAVAIASKGWNEKFLPGRSAVGRRVKLGGADSTRPWLSIVGVVGDVHNSSLEGVSRPCLYYPYAQNPGGMLSLVVRTREPGAVISSIRREVE